MFRSPDAKLAVKSASAPTNVFLPPVVFLKPVDAPTNELLFPVVFSCPADLPKNELRLPVPMSLPALVPTRVLLNPEELAKPARLPIYELPSPVELTPASGPRKRLPIPSRYICLPFRLNCADALTIFPESVPPAVPLPDMLKFEEACCVAEFCI